MAKDPYASGMFVGSPYYAKSDINGSLVVVLQGSFEERGLELIKPTSRCVLKNEVHELIITDESDIKAGCRVDRIAYLGFVEITQGGVIIVGDEVTCNGKRVGFVAGFDETHMPNHLNIVISSDKRNDGVELGCSVGDGIVFRVC